jgi:hypothetical protein
LDKGGIPAIFGDHMDGLLPPVFIHIGNDQFRAFSRKGERGGSADA